MYCSDMSEGELRFRIRSDSPRYEQELASIGKYLKLIGGAGGGGGGGVGGTTFDITINWVKGVESHDQDIKVRSRMDLQSPK